MTDDARRPTPATAAALDLAALGRTWTPPHVVDVAPEVADVLARLPWWIARGLLYVVVGFVVAGLLWAHFSVVDMVVTARGVLVPEGYVRPVQTLGAGRVQYVLVREGDIVERGQVLVQLEASALRGRVDTLRGELRITREQLRQMRVAQGPVPETLDHENRIARLSTELAGAELDLEKAAIVAPAGGVITTLAVRGAGAVVQPGQTVASIAPAGARLLAEVEVANKDSGLLARGLRVKLKFDAFPFQDYGVVDGRIVEISPDARGDGRSESFYRVTIAPGQTTMAAGGDLPLRPGLALTAEIVTDRKSVLDILFEPWRKLRRQLPGP